MKAGHELDALVAKKVMGLKGVKLRAGFIDRLVPFHRISKPQIVATIAGSYYDDGLRVVPRYSTDITAAWEVVEKLSEKNIQISVRDGGVTVEVDAGSIDSFQSISGYPLPLAICIAALGALP